MTTCKAGTAPPVETLGCRLSPWGPLGLGTVASGSPNGQAGVILLFPLLDSVDLSRDRALRLHGFPCFGYVREMLFLVGVVLEPPRAADLEAMTSRELGQTLLQGQPHICHSPPEIPRKVW